MKFEERLLNARKLRGMSQEALAEKIGVSRQAVSKWETGDAQPDYTKLIALADALEVSLDYLCGRDEVTVNNPEVPIQGEASKKRKGWPWLVGVLAALVLVGIGVFAGWQIANREQGTVEPAAPYLPDTVEISGTNFGFGSFVGESRCGIECQFVPNIVGEQYTYRVHFKDLNGAVHSFEAELDGGFYTSLADLPNGHYSVTVTVSNGVESRSALLAGELTISDNSFSWR